MPLMTRKGKRDAGNTEWTSKKRFGSGSVNRVRSFTRVHGTIAFHKRRWPWKGYWKTRTKGMQFNVSCNLFLLIQIGDFMMLSFLS